MADYRKIKEQRPPFFQFVSKSSINSKVKKKQRHSLDQCTIMTVPKESAKVTQYNRTTYAMFSLDIKAMLDFRWKFKRWIIYINNSYTDIFLTTLTYSMHNVLAVNMQSEYDLLATMKGLKRGVSPFWWNLIFDRPYFPVYRTEIRFAKFDTVLSSHGKKYQTMILLTPCLTTNEVVIIT